MKPESLAKTKPNNIAPGTDENVRNLISDLNNIIRHCDDNDDSVSVDFNTTSCKYYECKDFNNSLNLKRKHLSAFHLNIASLAKHFDDLNSLLTLLKHEFSVIGISESRILKNIPPNFDMDIDGYKCFQTPTESTAGGTVLYISNRHTKHPRTDLDRIMYQSKNLESSFAEIVFPKRTNIIVGTIYRHPCMPVDSFNRDFLAPLLHKVSSEKKQILLLGGLQY